MIDYRGFDKQLEHFFAAEGTTGDDQSVVGVGSEIAKVAIGDDALKFVPGEYRVRTVPGQSEAFFGDRELAITAEQGGLAGFKGFVEGLVQKAASLFPEQKEIERKDQQGKEGGSVKMNKVVQQEEQDESNGA